MQIRSLCGPPRAFLVIIELPLACELQVCSAFMAVIISKASCGVFIAISWLAGCHAPRSSIREEVAGTVSLSVDSIPAAPLSGTLPTGPFSLQSARYWIDRRPGYEKVDIKLSTGKVSSPCSEPLPNDAPSVWLRRVGTTRLSAETVHVSRTAPGPWEVHYQVMRDEQWLGSAKAEALLVLHPLTSDKRLQGELSVCFADPDRSCVLGAFAADYCQLSIDAPIRGTQLMESPVAGQRADDHQQAAADLTPQVKP
jgi:hypothetical protein